MLNRLLIISAFTLSSAAVANATPVTGAFAATGSDSFTSNTVTFLNPGFVGAGSPTLTFATYLTAASIPITFFPAFPSGTPLPYVNGPNSVPPAIIAPGQTGVELFSVTGGGEEFDFYLTDYNAQYTTGATGCIVATCLAVSGDGYFIGSGVVAFAATPGVFSFTSQEVPLQNTVTTFSASVNATPPIPTGPSPVPEPGSLALVGTGILGAAGFLRRKFKS